MKISEKRKLEWNIKKYYIFEIFTCLAFFMPIVVLFWQENGLSLTEIMILQSLFALTFLFLEVPSGYFADVFGRKKSLILASLFLVFGTFAYSLGHNFYQFLVAEILWAMGISFMSGTNSAFIYDTLVELKKERSYSKIWGNIMFYGMMGIAFASVIGGFIGKINFRWTFYAMIPFLLALIPLAFSLKEPKRHKVIFKKGYFLELLKIVKFCLVDNKKIKWLIIYSAVLFGFLHCVLWLYQPYLVITGLDIAYFGFVFAFFNVIAAVSAKYAHKIEKKLGQKYSLILLFILVSGSYFFMSNFVFLFSFLFAFFQQFVRGFSRVIFTDYINKLTTSDIRATVLSAQNLVGRLFYAMVIPFIGMIADVYSIINALTVLGFTTLFSGIVVIFLLYKNKVI